MGEQQHAPAQLQRQRGLSDDAKRLGVIYGLVGLGISSLGSAFGNQFYPTFNKLPPGQKAALIGTVGMVGFILGVDKSSKNKQ